MLRFLYTVLDIIATVCAVISPVAIVHWLLKSIQLALLGPFIEALDPVFSPLNLLLEVFIQLPNLQFMDQSVPLTQGALGILFTLGFFIFNFASNSLRVADQKLTVAHDLKMEQRRMAKILKEQERVQRKISTNRQVFVWVNFDFTQNTNATSILETTFARHSADVRERDLEHMLLEFQTLDHALQYVLQCQDAILKHYATLRPIDPKPPFTFGINSFEITSDPEVGIALAQQLSKYAGKNQILFSKDAHDLLAALGLTAQYKFQSQGFYDFLGLKKQEVFRLMGRA